jgi:hypothetical protein
MTQAVLMLSGYMKSGKDTVGDYLCENYGFTRFAFADVLKDEVSQIYNIERSLLDTQEGKASTVLKSGGHPFKSRIAIFIFSLFGKTTTIRRILIKHGQKRRKENVSYWVDKVSKKIKGSNVLRAVITDWRFPNEYTRLREEGWNIVPWRIHRWSEPPLIDETELALDNFVTDDAGTTVIDNTGSFKDLFLYVDEGILFDKSFPLFLVDVDDTLLNWIDSFKTFIRRETWFLMEGEYPRKWDLQGWITTDEGAPLSKHQLTILIKNFNHSKAFSLLAATEGSKKGLEKIQSFGYIVVAITACSDEPDIVEKREGNLQRHFGKNVNKVICLKLGEDKGDILSYFPPSLWVDDNVSHVLAGKACGHNSFLMNTVWNKNVPEDVDGSSVDRVNNWEEIEQLAAKGILDRSY